MLIRMVGRSKHPGHVAGSHFTRETLVAALRENGVAENTLIAAGVLRAKPIDDNVWHRYRDQIVTRFRSFRVYGLHVDRDVYADLPALFVPLRLAPIPSDRALYKDGRRARAMRSLAERLSAEDEQALDHTSDSDDEHRPNKGNVLDLAVVLAEKRRFAIVGGPGVGKTTTLKWLAITSTLPGDEGQRLRLV
jgi:predicted NACHT family NTPase